MTHKHNKTYDMSFKIHPNKVVEVTIDARNSTSFDKFTKYWLSLYALIPSMAKVNPMNILISEHQLGITQEEANMVETYGYTVRIYVIKENK